MGAEVVRPARGEPAVRRQDRGGEVSPVGPRGDGRERAGGRVRPHDPHGRGRQLLEPAGRVLPPAPRPGVARRRKSSQLFLGVRIGCAKCHNHPGENWTQDDYYGLAAFFARVQYRDGPFFIQIYDKEETVLAKRDAEVTHPRTGATVKPKFPGGRSSDARRRTPTGGRRSRSG